MPEQGTASAFYAEMPEDAALELRRWFAVEGVLAEAAAEREAQFKQWGAQELPMGFGSPSYRQLAATMREGRDFAAKQGQVTYEQILLTAFYDVLGEPDQEKARDQLLQLIAVGVQAIQEIDRAKAASDATE